MAILDDFQTKLSQVLQDDAEHLSTTERDAFISEAVLIYSSDRPRVIVSAITGAGTYEYDLPDDWMAGFSVALGVEYPAGNQIPTYVDESEWLIYQGTSGKTLRFLNYEPTAAETINLKHTALHIVDAATSTIPASDQDAVINLAGALGCYALSRKYAQSLESAIGADSVQHISKSGEYAKRGKELENLYHKHITAGDERPPVAASVIGDWDSLAGWQGDRLTHPKRYR
ncbi:MAG: hypothetical protein BZ151_10885 [Desulfobacca sp. 4484_104]|nr:MAG: hypothetical protein BZ151_10885 [Desulfobacca sp. 4484_104]RLA88036.1 MAG: hypothetical protein DRG58_09160 [Deltaproteobacteria bacterium]